MGLKDLNWNSPQSSNSRTPLKAPEAMKFFILSPNGQWRRRRQPGQIKIGVKTLGENMRSKKVRKGRRFRSELR